MILTVSCNVHVCAGLNSGPIAVGLRPTFSFSICYLDVNKSRIRSRETLECGYGKINVFFKNNNEQSGHYLAMK